MSESQGMLWLLVTAGRGPGECEIAVSSIVRILMDEARALAMNAEIIEAEEGEHGLSSALICLQGEQAEAFARSWTGSILWTCPSSLRKGWGRKRWFVGVSVLKPPAPAAAFRETDIRFEAYRASGPGGQHVNKTNSAVRLVHLPTGLVATAQEERSQHRNKALAMARLAASLAAQAHQGNAVAERDKWSRHDALERGNPVRIYDGERFRRVK